MAVGDWEQGASLGVLSLAWLTSAQAWTRGEQRTQGFRKKWGKGKEEARREEMMDTACVTPLCSGLNCKLPRGRALCIFWDLWPPHTWKQLGAELPVHKSLRLEQVEDREAGYSVRFWGSLRKDRYPGDSGKAN